MHPVLFTIPGINLPIHAYGVMLGISIVAGWFMTMYFGKQSLPATELKRLILVSAACALVGARLLAVITEWSHLNFDHPLKLLIPGHTGLVAYGGFMGGFLGAWVYTRKHPLSLADFADAATPSLALGLGITRIGCFLYGCDYGRPIFDTAPTWLKTLGIQFPNWESRFANDVAFAHHAALQKGAPAFWHHVHDGLVQSDATTSLPVYPAQLVSSLNGFILFGLLLLLKNRFSTKGHLFLFFVMYYGFTRTLIEFIRGDSGRGVIFNLTTSQWIGMLSCVAAAIIFLTSKKRATS
ncbi:MAG: prolipoprotein diacylglyceryl transferase [Deltaproteobacteria bacterium]|nr:prolipoprotein diacylglyceryl transferase [Deltaproteobacteria bacterium]